MSVLLEEMAPERRGGIALLDDFIVISVLTGGTEKGPSLSYSLTATVVHENLQKKREKSSERANLTLGGEHEIVDLPRTEPEKGADVHGRKEHQQY